MAETQEAGASGKRATHRSPSHPAFDLREAVAKARVLYDKEALSYAPVRVAKSHWGYAEKSSSGIRALAALLHYGLLEEKGSGNTKEIRLSKLAQTIVLHPEPASSQRLNALRVAALKPKIYELIWRVHGPNLPSDKTLAYDLETKRGFNRDSIATFIKDFKATVAFAKLGDGATLSDDETKEEEHRKPGTRDEVQTKMPQVGRSDARQWDLTIPLIEGGQAILRLPIPLSKADYDLLVAMLTSNLKAAEKAITKPTLQNVFQGLVGSAPEKDQPKQD